MKLNEFVIYKLLLQVSLESSFKLLSFRWQDSLSFRSFFLFRWTLGSFFISNLIFTHSRLNHKSIKFNSWHFKTSTISRIVYTCIFKIFFRLEILLSFSHNLFSSEDFWIAFKILLFNLIDPSWVFNFKLI
jgi:hypothetical protein